MRAITISFLEKEGICQDKLSKILAENMDIDEFFRFYHETWEDSEVPVDDSRNNSFRY